MSEKIETTAALSVDSLSRSTPAQGTGWSILVSRTPDGRFWATTKGFLGIGHSASDAIEKLVQTMTAEEPTATDEPDTASRSLSAQPQPPTAT
jgi:hypothetical protein